MLSYRVIRTKHSAKLPNTFRLNRLKGTGDFLFIYFKTPVVFTLFDKIHNISSGTCILLSPGTPHAFYSKEGELIHDWMHFMPSDEEEFLNLGIDINTFFTIENLNFISTAIKTCEAELIYKDPLYEELISSEVSAMFIRIKRQMSEKASGHYANSFKALRKDIYTNPDKYLCIEDMAKTVNLSRSRFSIIYKKFFSIPPQKDHINAKISKATYLLSIGTLSLAEISESCGFNNIYHFIRQFRTVTGTTPGTYRKIHERDLTENSDTNS